MAAKRKLVVLTGAGISAESGLKTFRDSGGLWEGYDVETVASPDGWQRDPRLVLDFYNIRRKDVLNASPNKAHTELAALESFFDISIITQNIDDLHERAGSSHVLHLHGEILKMRSVADEHRLYDIKGDIHLGDLADDGFQLRPHVVWFGEAVPMIGKAVQEIVQADIFVLVGSSLNVYPAAGLLDFVPRSAAMFVVDKQIPPTHHFPAMHRIEKPATEGLPELRQKLLALL